ncbi:response regulator transcription factor (plasmid) [Azospirillum oryzae]|uniref:Response regulator transcription factor n=1 Tax=Azospirillum oryzae TaxID=286727 RepID=A0A6N1AZY2_9PROT|nr:MULTISPECIES: response regulator transcription factor [Azospirillum]KAA0585439.1 response regulator transcription factor [Azospirillum oryzae]PWC91544.1 hypothetical protein TSO5_19560 [Azospirillum sp. TSO5]QCG99130.1 response regulator transcription factor [Azospirillum sp. TSA2s]QKS54594.1 response regulator transcription factor [Azospirillum oryzae]GLR77474.1 DNA-binding response regulator [Azospirillum oryzae]
MRILLADDHWFLYESMARLLNEEIPGSEVVGVATLDDAFKEVDRDKAFDLILLDLNMPGMAPGGQDRFSCIDRIKEMRPDTPVAIISAEEDEDIVQEALSRGAAGYIPKSLARNSLVAAMQLLVSGMTFSPRPAIQRISSNADSRGERGPQRGGQKGASLSARESEVLSLMVQGLSNKAIAERLGVKEVTVKEHVSAILKKRGAKSRLEIIAAAVR